MITKKLKSQCHFTRENQALRAFNYNGVIHLEQGTVHLTVRQSRFNNSGTVYVTTSYS